MSQKGEPIVFKTKKGGWTKVFNLESCNIDIATLCTYVLLSLDILDCCIYTPVCLGSISVNRSLEEGGWTKVFTLDNCNDTSIAALSPQYFAVMYTK